MKTVEWCGAANEELRGMPKEARYELGYLLWQVQQGEFPTGTKVMKGLGGALELRANHVAGGWFRLIVQVKGDTVYVAHGFQKKSNGTPATVVKTAAQRLKAKELMK